MCPEASLPTAVTNHPAAIGWQCPCCRTTHAPQVLICRSCSPAYRVPGHIIRAIEADLAHARANAVPGQRIIRGNFVLHYIEQMLNALKGS